MSISKLGDGRYRVWVYLGRDRSGRKRWHTQVIRGMRKDAERRERELKQELDRGTFPTYGAMTLGEFLAAWLSSVKNLPVPI